MYGTQSFWPRHTEVGDCETLRKAILNKSTKSRKTQTDLKAVRERSKYCKSLCQWNISGRRFDRQRGEKLTRTSSTKVSVFRKLSETCELWPERVKVLRKVETASTTRRATWGVKQNKAKKIETGQINYEVAQPEQLEVLSEKQQERSRQSSKVNNKQSDSRCWANQSKKDWDGDLCL